MDQGARVLILGLDGATWTLADRFIADGGLPNLARLKREGAWSALNSTTPPMTLPSWSSMLTGCNPGRHGIYDFVRKVPGRWELEFTNSTHRRVPTIHRVLSDRGHRVVSVAVPTTWPPDPLNGVVVSGFDSPVSTGIDGSFCHPRSLYGELQERFGGLKFADFQETEIGPGWHQSALDALLREVPRKQAIGEWLLGQERWDCFMLLFGESDTVCHHFWMFQDPTSPRHPAEAPEALRTAVRQVYERLDEAVGALIEKAQPDHVCICSDHGFGGAGEHVLYLNRYLESQGWLHYRPRKRTPAKGIGAGSGWFDRVKDAAVRHVPSGLQGRLFRAIPGRVLGRLESKSRYGDIDIRRTRALSDEMNYAATIRLNLPEADRASAVTALRQVLLAWEVDGQKVVDRVYTAAELYDGDALDEAPDLVLELALRDGHSYTLLPSGRAAPGQTWRKLRPEEHAGGKGLGMNGSHRQHGVLLLWGRGVQAGAEVAANMPDIAPTLLHLMGEAVPEHMDGQVLYAALVGDQPESREPWQGQHAGPRRTEQDEAAAIRKRLERLGYL